MVSECGDGYAGAGGRVHSVSLECGRVLMAGRAEALHECMGGRAEVEGNDEIAGRCTPFGLVCAEWTMMGSDGNVWT